MLDEAINLLAGAIALHEDGNDHASLQTTDTYLSHIAPKQVIEVMSARSWDAP